MARETSANRGFRVTQELGPVPAPMWLAAAGLRRSDGFSGDAAYSPDGNRLAFDSDQGDDPGRQSIYTMSAADGSRVRRVTKLPDWAALELTPRFAPDGRRILFTRYLRVDRGEGVPPEEPSALYLVDVDGSHLRRITDFDLKAGDADWSPDGRWIVFETIADRVENDPGDVYVVRSDGSRLTNLTHNTGATGEGESFRYTESSDPMWSPDGRTIMFTDDVFTPQSYVSGFATMKPDGSWRAYVASPQLEHQVDWESRRWHR